MARNKVALFEAVQLLDEIIDQVTVSVSPKGGEGSTRLLLIRLQRVKDILGGALENRSQAGLWLSCSRRQHAGWEAL